MRGVRSQRLQPVACNRSRSLEGSHVGRLETAILIFNLRMNVTRSFLAIVIVVATASTARGQSSADEQAFRQAAALADPSIVRIETVGGLDVVGDLLTGTGPTTGVVVGADGDIITSSFNFLSKPASILVTLADGRRFAARQVASDRSRMLTLLKVDASDLTPLLPAPKAGLQVGQWAIALGRTYDSPFPGLSVGIVSALDRIFGRAVQTDAKVSPVNYGGPLVDLEGRGIGILVPLSPQGADETAGVEWYDSGIGFAVPLADVYAVLDRLKSGKDLRAGLAGVSFQGSGVLAGVPQIDRVRPNSPADKAGLLVGDVITAVDGTAVDRLPALQHLLGPHYAGETVTLTIRRGANARDVPVTLIEELVPYAASYLGILPERPPLATASMGVTVRAVLDGSPAAEADIKTGDVISAIGDEPLTDARMLRDRIGRIDPGQVARLEVQSGGQTRSVEFKFTPIPHELPHAVPATTIPDRAQPAAENAPQIGRYSATLPGDENAREFWVYVPENYNPDYAYGMLVWLHPAGDTLEAALLREWQKVCEERGIILAGPKAADINGWTPDESEVVRGVVDDLRSKYSIDPARIALHGAGIGGTFAWQVAFKHRDLFRGVAVVSAPLSQPPPDNDPDFPLQIVAACGQEARVQPRVEASVQLLQQMKFPAVLLPVPGKEVSPESLAAQIAAWLDALDRI